MKIISSANELKKYLREQNKSIGYVPTMGALHRGHIELVKKYLLILKERNIPVEKAVLFGSY